MQAEVHTASRHPMLEFITPDDVTIRARVYGPESADTRIIVSHGNGLAAHGYASFWQPLTEDHQVVVLDFRGHGLSDRGSLENHNWGRLEEDFDLVMRAIPDELGSRTTIGAFHSLSAVVSLQHARRFGPILDGLVLFDPPIIPPDDHPMQSLHVEEMMNLGRRVRRRRTHFDDWRELAEQLQRNAMYARCRPEACEQLARALLRAENDDENGGWVLACDPEHEAKIFESNSDTTLWPWLQHVNFPLKLLCADPAVPGVQPSAALGQDLAKTFGLDYACVPGTTHFLQLERPDLCTDLTRDFCREACRTS